MHMTHNYPKLYCTPFVIGAYPWSREGLGTAGPWERSTGESFGPGPDLAARSQSTSSRVCTASTPLSRGSTAPKLCGRSGAVGGIPNLCRKACGVESNAATRVWVHRSIPHASSNNFTCVSSPSSSTPNRGSSDSFPKETNTCLVSLFPSCSLDL